MSTIRCHTKLDQMSAMVCCHIAGNAGDNDLWLVQDDWVIPDAPDHFELFGYSLAAVPDIFHRVHLPLVIRAD